VLTVSTACSSGAVGIKLALEILRRGAARSVLVGGADSLCRLTYYGFNSLQIVDRSGPHPMDRDRHGMSVAEGAAMLLLTAADQAPPHAVAEVVGGGLSCDAYHPAAPHPEGRGAREAMLAALEDAGLSPDAVDYINLHGTGTVENDLGGSRGAEIRFYQPFPTGVFRQGELRAFPGRGRRHRGGCGRTVPPGGLYAGQRGLAAPG
jgi:3-oxoacyl-(acyl-carrier-protein) synthase